MSDNAIPNSIRRVEPSGIEIDWSDGRTTRWTSTELRQACPCATCREKRRAKESEQEAKPKMLPVLSAAEARPLAIESMKPVGTYAYNIGFTDGHSSGLFTFEMLRREVEPKDWTES